MTQTAAQRRFVRLAGSMNKKAARLGRNGRLTPEMLALTFIASKSECYYCEIEISPTECSFDHIVPFQAGGLNVMENLAATCLTCNRRKASRLAAEYALARVHRANCEVCGREFVPRWADVRRGYGTTCSAKCAGAKGRAVRSQLFVARSG